jgi:hypothetical protein
MRERERLQVKLLIFVSWNLLHKSSMQLSTHHNEQKVKEVPIISLLVRGFDSEYV